MKLPAGSGSIAIAIVKEGKTGRADRLWELVAVVVSY
jgi:hypothetical protein